MGPPFPISLGVACAFALALAVAACTGAPPTRPAPDLDDPPPERPQIPPGPYVPGQSYFGTSGYVEYVAGDAPVVLSAPHGGAMEPAGIPDRGPAICGGSATTGADRNTVELTMAVRAAFEERFGRSPHVVLNHLARIKLDANREIGEAACGNAESEVAWAQFHAFIDAATTEVVSSEGRGWYMDMHGHGHEIQRLELGFLLRGSYLDQPDAVLDGNPAYADTSSLNTVVDSGGPGGAAGSLAALLRGPKGLGTLYDGLGFRSVPSAAEPGPLGQPYFTGGYNTVRHTCTVRAGSLGGVPGGPVCGVQVEAQFVGVRDAPANRAAFGAATAEALEVFLRAHWGIELRRSSSGGP